MNVTIVCDVLGKENNGTTIAAMNLIRSLKKKGHRVRILCGDADKRGEADAFIVPNLNLGLLNRYVAKNGVAIAKPDRKIVGAAIEGADVVHIMTPFWLGTLAARLAHRRGIPVTAGFHCQAENFTNHIFMMNFSLANRIAYRIFYHNVYRYCAAVHYPTDFIRSVFEKEVGETPHWVISNGVGADFYPRAGTKPDEFKRRFVILFTGRYSKEKSHRILIEGVRRSAHEKEIQLIFAGDGPLREKLQKQAALLTHAPVFRFFPHEEMLDVLSYADLYVHPAEIEIEAIACLEAIACGKVPLISDSPRSATRYFALSKENLFNCNDASDLARKIDFWIENPEKRFEMREKYLGYAARFNSEACMDQMEKMLREASGKE